MTHGQQCIIGPTEQIQLSVRISRVSIPIRRCGYGEKKKKTSINAQKNAYTSTRFFFPNFKEELGGKGNYLAKGKPGQPGKD